MKELIEIQSRLVAPKNQKNTFGNYNYRNLEGIMEAVKPLLKMLNCTITFNDDLVMMGERIFIKSTCTLKNSENEIESSVSFAELDNHKGMSKEQSTGSASSYARKYAVCSLLAIDDNADPDMLDNSEEPTEEQKFFKLTNKELLIEFCKKTKETIMNDESKKQMLENFYRYYSPKCENWNGKFEPYSLYKGWCERAKTPRTIPSNSNDIAIQTYEESTY